MADTTVPSEVLAYFPCVTCLSETDLAKYEFLMWLAINNMAVSVPQALGVFTSAIRYKQLSDFELKQLEIAKWFVALNPQLHSFYVNQVLPALCCRNKHELDAAIAYLKVKYLAEYGS